MVDTDFILNGLKELLPYIIIIIVVIVIRTFFFTPVLVNGDSMKPTLKDKQLLLLNKYDKKLKRFDIVVLTREFIVSGYNENIKSEVRLLDKINGINPATGEKYRDIAKAMGVDGADAMSLEEARKAAIDAVKQLSIDVGIPADLKEIVKAEDVPFLAQSAFDDACRPGNPRETSVEEITALYNSLL